MATMCYGQEFISKPLHLSSTRCPIVHLGLPFDTKYLSLFTLK